jgi:eukaryotic-like serine/threonine-protein kinase
VDLFDFGIADDGTFYYVMELLEGWDAERIVNKFGPMPVGRVIHVIRQVCHSLSEAESISLVHRDIKPANIVLCHYGEDYDFVKVLDFGIVKAIEEPGTAGGAATLTALTAEHVVRGTPAFIAPEQVLGGRPVDHRADVYGIGCLTYWLLTGKLVFSGDKRMQLLTQHAQAVPEPPSARTELRDSERTAYQGRVDQGTGTGMVGNASARGSVIPILPIERFRGGMSCWSRQR